MRCEALCSVQQHEEEKASKQEYLQPKFDDASFLMHLCFRWMVQTSCFAYYERMRDCVSEAKVLRQAYCPCTVPLFVSKLVFFGCTKIRSCLKLG